MLQEPLILFYLLSDVRTALDRRNTIRHWPTAVSVVPFGSTRRLCRSRRAAGSDRGCRARRWRRACRWKLRRRRSACPAAGWAGRMCRWRTAWAGRATRRRLCRRVGRVDAGRPPGRRCRRASWSTGCHRQSPRHHTDCHLPTTHTTLT